MPRYSLSTALLTLFTSPEHAQSIAGDLLEESRGAIWFWSQMARTCLALWWKRFSERPFALGGLTFAWATVWFLALFWGELDDSPGLVVVGPLLVGFACVRAAPVLGIHAALGIALLATAVITAICILTFLPVEAVTAVKPSLWEGVVAVVTLLLGSLVARHQLVKNAATV